MNPHDEDDLNQVDDSQFDDLGDSSFDQDQLEDMNDDFGTEGDAWGDDQNANYDEGEGSEPAQKKKSSLLSYLLIGAVVLGAGGFGYVKFFGSKPPGVVAQNDGAPLPASDRSSLTALRDQPGDQYMPTPADAPPAPAPTGTKSQGGFMNAPVDEQAAGSPPSDPASLPIPTLAPGLPPGGPSMTAVETPETTPPADTLPPAGTQAEQPADPGVALLPGIKPTSDFPSVDLIKKATPTAVEAPVTPNVPAPVVPEVEPQTTPQLTAETPTMAPTLTPNVAPELPAGISPAPTLSGDVPTTGDTAASIETQEKLSAAESRIAELEKELADAKAAALKAADRPFERNSSADPVNIERPSKPKAVKPVREANEPKRVVRSDDTPSAKPVLKSNWELRGAQPGQAMVSTKGGKGDIRTVFVGDTLSGVGRITAITRTPSGWVVRGTNGTLHQ